MKTKNKTKEDGKPSPKGDAHGMNPNTRRGNKRKDELKLAAEVNGFATWSGMLTYIKNRALQGKAVVYLSMRPGYSATLPPARGANRRD
jgi:hypothetical protein